MRKALTILLGALAALALVPFAVANRHTVAVTFDPFGRLDSVLALDVPLSLALFVTFMAGLLLGGLVTWLSQGKWRRTARHKTREAYRWKSEADRLHQDRDETRPPAPAKLAHGR